MLTSEPPHLIFDGVSIFTDHADPQQLYYLPISPHIARREVGGRELPQFSLIEFGDGEEDGVSGGLLNFTTSLGVEPERLEEIRSQAMDALGLDEEPRLSPVPMIDGTAHLILMGRATAENEDEALVVETSFVPPDSEGNEPESRFVRHMTHTAKPSLYGEQWASFSAELSRDGAEIIRQSLDDIIVPAAVMYSLTFASLRPAYKVSVKADWDRVQKHLKKKFGVNLLVFSSSIEEAVDELIEDRVITIEADTFITAQEEDAATLLANKDRALARVNEMVAETFFTPSLNPWKPPKEGWEKALDAVERLAFIQPFGGEDALFSYNNIDYTRIDKKKLNASFSERTAIRRTIYPQAHLNGMVGALTESGLTIDDVVSRVRLGDPWYDSRKLEVFNRADFERDGITSIRVELDYFGTQRTVLFDQSEDDAGDEAEESGFGGQRSAERSWPSKVDDREMLLDVNATYTVDFNDEVTAGGLARVERTLPTVTGSVIEVDPVGDELYLRNDVAAVTPAEFPWDRYSSVEVWFGHPSEPDGEIVQRAHERLIRPEDGQAAPEAKYRYTSLVGQPDCFYRVTYHGLEAGTVAASWVPVDGDLALLVDPFPNKRRLTILGALPWADYVAVFVDLEIRQPDGTVVARDSVQLSDQDTSKEFVADLPDPSLQEVDYRITAIRTDGTVIETPASVTRNPRIVVAEPFAVSRSVRVGLEPVDFARARIESVTVRLSHNDSANGLRSTDEYVFIDPTDVAFFDYEFVDDEAEAYQVEVESRSTSGTRRSLSEPLSTTARALSLRLP